MNEVILTAEERDNYIQWCALISGYHVSCFEKLSDFKLQEEFQQLNGIQEEN